MNIHYANCKHENWEACKKHRIFGLRTGNLPNIEPSDIILVRMTGHSGQPYGVRAIWQCESVAPVDADTLVPWTDGEYSWIVHFSPVVEFSKPFSEDFATSSKISQKINGLYATRLMGSMGVLKPSEANAYIQGILKEFGTELRQKTSNNHRDQGAYDIIQSYLQNAKQPMVKDKVTPPRLTIAEARPEESATEERILRQSSLGVVGERIDLPILNYAPLNEMGVILLFGYYMKDLGFSHLEEIRTDFPDAIGMQKIDARKYRRVRIEFEYKSRNFLVHGHATKDCDVIVCWEHNWPECSLEVIELQKVLFQE